MASKAIDELRAASFRGYLDEYSDPLVPLADAERIVEAQLAILEKVAKDADWWEHYQYCQRILSRAGKPCDCGLNDFRAALMPEESK